jgi:hypothetical protein
MVRDQEKVRGVASGVRVGAKVLLCFLTFRKYHTKECRNLPMGSTTA